MLKKHTSIHQAYQEYTEDVRYTHRHDPVKAERILNEFQSGFLRGPLRAWGFEPTSSSRKMTQEDVNAAFELIGNLSVQRLLHARADMAKSFSEQGLSEASCKIYTNRVEQFLKRSEQRDWWPSERNLRLQNECCPPQQQGRGRYTDMPLTHRRGMYLQYQLQESQISPQLRAELDSLYKYLTLVQLPGRLDPKVGPSTAKLYLREMRLVLGYLHRQGVPLEALSLDLLFPVITRQQLKGLDEDERDELWHNAKLHIEGWLFPYFQFMRDELYAISPRTIHNKYCAYSAALKCRYLMLSKGIVPHPLLEMLKGYQRQARNEIKTWIKTRRRVANLDLKWPDPVPGKTALVIVQGKLSRDCASKPGLVSLLGISVPLM